MFERTRKFIKEETKRSTIIAFLVIMLGLSITFSVGLANNNYNMILDNFTKIVSFTTFGAIEPSVSCTIENKAPTRLSKEDIVSMVRLKENLENRKMIDSLFMMLQTSILTLSITIAYFIRRK